MSNCQDKLQSNVRTGKTLILEAATQSLSKKMNTEVVFVMALGEAEPTRENRKKCLIYKVLFLDYARNSKKSDDILDIMFRQKYEGTNISFKSIADLRRDFPSGKPLGVLNLIKSYVERTTRKDMVRYSFGVAPNILSQQVKYFK